MIWLILFLVLSVVALVVVVFLLGFRLGGHSWLIETHRVRAEAAAAERQLHDLTRSAFVAMSEAAERRGASHDRGWHDVGS